METENRDDSLVIGRRSVSFIIAMIVMLGVTLFAVGYFWGYKSASREVSNQVKQQGFTDKVHNAVYETFGVNGDESLSDNSEKIDGSKVSDSGSVTAAQIIEKDNASKDNATSADKKKQYYAQIIGFGTLKPAQSFVDKAQKKGYPVRLRKRVGETPTGKVTHWYQAVTNRFSDKAKLDKLVDAIKRTERIKKVEIVEVSS